LAQPSELEQLEARRRLLVAESDQHRRQIARELEQLRPVALWAEKGYSLAQSLRTWWPAVAFASGFFLTRKGVVRKRGFLLRMVGKAWSGWQIGKRLAPFWRRLYQSVSDKDRSNHPGDS